MVFGACVFVMNDDGLILGITRKNEPDKWGIVGGKVEMGEAPLEAALRELKEETGLEVRPDARITLIYQDEHKGYLTAAYDVKIQDLVGKLPEVGKHIPAVEEGTLWGWVDTETLIRGPFGKFNLGLFQTLGIAPKKRKLEFSLPSKKKSLS